MQNLSPTWQAQRSKDDKSNANIIVAVRIRPETTEELNSWRTVVKVLDDNVLVFDPADLNRHVQRGLPNHSQRRRDIKFAFDWVFDQYATQEEVYERTTKHLISEVLSGFNCTCFAYGATGAGKTFTMIGNAQSPGIMVLTMNDLFKAIKQSENEKQYKLSISYLEVYNEQIRDLLVENSKALALREDPEKGCHVSGLSEYSPTSADEVMKLLEIGNARRTQHPTDANSQSSRSHAVLQITVRQVDRTADVAVDVRTGKLSLIDLAGSERAARTKNRGARLVEGANINRSLLALGNCINALGEGYREGKYVPYRDSKLTRLLKDSLGGNCKTVMIANISPSSMSYEDTFNTLQYANRAKNIKTKVTRNVINVKFHVGQYKEIIASLRSEVAELKEKLRNAESKAPLQDQAKDNCPEVEKIRNEIQNIVNERISLTKSLMDLQNQEDTVTRNLEDTLQELAKWENEYSVVSGQNMQRMTPSRIRNLRRQLEDIKISERQNDITKAALLKKLQRIVEDTQQIQQELAIQNQQQKAVILMIQDMSIHWLELEKLQRDLELRKRDAMIRQLARALQQQFAILQKNGLTNEHISEQTYRLSESVQRLCDQNTVKRLSGDRNRNDNLSIRFCATPMPKEHTNSMGTDIHSNSKTTDGYNIFHDSPTSVPMRQTVKSQLSSMLNENRCHSRHSLSPLEFSQYHVPFSNPNEVVFYVPPLVSPLYSFKTVQPQNHINSCNNNENTTNNNTNDNFSSTGKSEISNSNKQPKSILVKSSNNKMSNDIVATPITKRKKHVTFANSTPSPQNENEKENSNSKESYSLTKEKGYSNIRRSPLLSESESKTIRTPNATSSRRRPPTTFNPLESEIFKPLTTAMREQLRSPALTKTKKWGFYHGRWGFFRK
jgi:kinesin family protein 18/19